MHPYQKYVEILENQYNSNVEDLIRHFYIIKDKGPSVTAKELGIPREAVIYFIQEFNLRAIKHQNIKKSSNQF